MEIENVKMQIKSLSNNSENINEAMYMDKDLALKMVDAEEKDSATRLATAIMIDTFSRGITALTTNNYRDTEFTITAKDTINPNA